MISRGHIFLTLVCFKTCINSTTCHTINVSQKHWKLISMLLITQLKDSSDGDAHAYTTAFEFPEVYDFCFLLKANVKFFFCQNPKWLFDRFVVVN